MYIELKDKIYDIETIFKPHILSTAVAYLCVIAAQHFLNDPYGDINTGDSPVLVPLNTIVCGVIIA